MTETTIAWRPGVGDPDFHGWLCVVAYSASALGCAWAAWGKKSEQEGNPGQRGRVGWRVLTVFLVLLGINKQLDLQTLLIELGRKLAVSEGWYEHRRAAQLVFALCFDVGAVALTSFMIYRGRQFITENPWAVAGMLILLCFVMLRATTINHGDERFGLHARDEEWGWLLEVLGNGFVIGGVLRKLRKSVLPYATDE